jgi:putative colanic acid biosynthesis UDP-glucose lipid carrier transferase
MSDAPVPFRVAAQWTAPAVAPANVANSLLKRAFDLFVVLLAMPFVAPALGLLALAILIDSRGPVLFRQRRTGLGGKTFVIYKLRSMSVTEDGEGLKHATKNDARVTRVGAFLRKSSLDELPQLINVLKGDMSLIGPRPHALSHDKHYAALIPGYDNRFRAKPGLTGLAQVTGLRGEIHELTCMSKRVAADGEYVDRWSFWLDVEIMLRTVPLVLKASNAY